MQNIETLTAHAATLESIFADLSKTIQDKDTSRAARRKLLKVSTLVDRASSILSSLAEDEERAEERETQKQAKAAKPKQKKPGKVVKLAAARSSTSSVKKSK